MACVSCDNCNLSLDEKGFVQIIIRFTLYSQKLVFFLCNTNIKYERIFIHNSNCFVICFCCCCSHLLFYLSANLYFINKFFDKYKSKKLSTNFHWRRIPM
jgi:hypothetical protein